MKPETDSKSIQDTKAAVEEPVCVSIKTTTEIDTKDSSKTLDKPFPKPRIVKTPVDSFEATETEETSESSRPPRDSFDTISSRDLSRDQSVDDILVEITGTVEDDLPSNVELSANICISTSEGKESRRSSESRYSHVQRVVQTRKRIIRKTIIENGIERTIEEVVEEPEVINESIHEGGFSGSEILREDSSEDSRSITSEKMRKGFRRTVIDGKEVIEEFSDESPIITEVIEGEDTGVGKTPKLITLTQEQPIITISRESDDSRDQTISEEESSSALSKVEYSSTEIDIPISGEIIIHPDIPESISQHYSNVSSREFVTTIQSSTRTRVKSVRRVIRKVIIRDGKEEITEEVIDEPEEVDVEQSSPHISTYDQAQSTSNIVQLVDIPGNKDIEYTFSEGGNVQTSIHSVTRTVNRVVKRIQIIDGKEVVTEELIQDPSDSSIAEVDSPSVTVCHTLEPTDEGGLANSPDVLVNVSPWNQRSNENSQAVYQQMQEKVSELRGFDESSHTFDSSSSHSRVIRKIVIMGDQEAEHDASGPAVEITEVGSQSNEIVPEPCSPSVPDIGDFISMEQEHTSKLLLTEPPQEEKVSKHKKDKKTKKKKAKDADEVKAVEQKVNEKSKESKVKSKKAVSQEKIGDLNEKQVQEPNRDPAMKEEHRPMKLKPDEDVTEIKIKEVVTLTEKIAEKLRPTKIEPDETLAPAELKSTKHEKKPKKFSEKPIGISDVQKDAYSQDVFLRGLKDIQGEKFKYSSMVITVMPGEPVEDIEAKGSAKIEEKKIKDKSKKVKEDVHKSFDPEFKESSSVNEETIVSEDNTSEISKSEKVDIPKVTKTSELKPSSELSVNIIGNTFKDENTEIKHLDSKPKIVKKKVNTSLPDEETKTNAKEDVTDIIPVKKEQYSPKVSPESEGVRMDDLPMVSDNVDLKTGKIKKSKKKRPSVKEVFSSFEDTEPSKSILPSIQDNQVTPTEQTIVSTQIETETKVSPERDVKSFKGKKPTVKKAVKSSEYGDEKPKVELSVRVNEKGVPVIDVFTTGGTDERTVIESVASTAEDSKESGIEEEPSVPPQPHKSNEVEPKKKSKKKREKVSPVVTQSSSIEDAIEPDLKTGMTTEVIINQTKREVEKKPSSEICMSPDSTSEDDISRRTIRKAKRKLPQIHKSEGQIDISSSTSIIETTQVPVSIECSVPIMASFPDEPDVDVEKPQNNNISPESKEPVEEIISKESSLSTVSEGTVVLSEQIIAEKKNKKKSKPKKISDPHVKISATVTSDTAESSSNVEYVISRDEPNSVSLAIQHTDDTVNVSVTTGNNEAETQENAGDRVTRVNVSIGRTPSPQGRTGVTDFIESERGHSNTVLFAEKLQQAKSEGKKQTDSQTDLPYTVSPEKFKENEMQPEAMDQVSSKVLNLKSPPPMYQVMLGDITDTCDINVINNNLNKMKEAKTEEEVRVIIVSTIVTITEYLEVITYKIYSTKVLPFCYTLKF